MTPFLHAAIGALPIRARPQTSADVIRATVPTLRFAPALGLNDCPARIVLSQRFVMQ
jgi:hypothetical protein